MVNRWRNLFVHVGFPARMPRGLTLGQQTDMLAPTTTRGISCDL
jgi:hypothetical protein